MTWRLRRLYVLSYEGMGTLHAWECFGDGIAPDIQICAKGLAAGYLLNLAECENNLMLFLQISAPWGRPSRKESFAGA